MPLRAHGYLRVQQNINLSILFLFSQGKAGHRLEDEEVGGDKDHASQEYGQQARVLGVPLQGDQHLDGMPTSEHYQDIGCKFRWYDHQGAARRAGQWQR